MSKQEPSEFMAAMSAVRAALNVASRAADSVIELTTFGTDAKGKERKELISELDDMLGVAEKCLNDAVESWTDLSKTSTWCERYDGADEEDDGEEGDEDDEDDEE